MAILSETRTTHTITIDLPDDIIRRIESGDEVEIMFNGRGWDGARDVRTPRPIRLPYTMIRWITGGRA